MTEVSDTADSFAIYMEDEVGLTDSFYLTPGVRYNYHTVDMTSDSDKLDKSWNNVSFALAAKYLVTEQWTLQASATQLFKGPALRETYVNYNSTFDPNLKAETGLNTEVGVGYVENNIIGLDHLGFSTTLFKTDLNDYIDDWSIGKKQVLVVMRMKTLVIMKS